MLEGSYSAWTGLRAHGDLTVTDPITGNAFNSAVMEFNQQIGFGAPNSRSFPGYGSQMDQMLYRDLDLAGPPPDSPVRITFELRTRMSAGKGTVAQTRTGWFEATP